MSPKTIITLSICGAALISGVVLLVIGPAEHNDMAMMLIISALAGAGLPRLGEPSLPKAPK